MSWRGAWSAVTVSVAEPPGEIVVPPVICKVGTLVFLIVVCAELGLRPSSSIRSAMESDDGRILLHHGVDTRLHRRPSWTSLPREGSPTTAA